jgi:hypothetical protein
LEPEKFLYEFLGEHGLHDILQDFLAALIPDLLGAKALVEDVDHLTSEVNDDKREDGVVST